jgi:hypothetical protein
MKTSIGNIAPNDMRVDPAYQRDLSERHVQRIAQDYDKFALGLISVSRRANGYVYILDGQHRVEALRRIGVGHVPIQCLVYEGITPPEEADVFYMQSKTKRLSSVDIFRARLVAKEPIATEIAEIVGEFGYKINSNNSQDSIQAPTMMERIFTGHGPERLRKVCSIVKRIWTDQRVATPGYIFMGIDAFLNRYEDIADEGRLVRVLAATPKAEIEEAAKSMKKFLQDKFENRYGRAIAHIYNKGLQNRLEDWDIRTREISTKNITEFNQSRRAA